MSWRIAATGLLVLLGGCAAVGLPPTPTSSESIQGPLDQVPLLGRLHVDVDETYTETPFENGVLALVASEGGELKTWTLAPCGSGAICAGDAQGAVGRMSRTREYVVVDGLYGRRFWLSWGGDGYVERDGTYLPLAWNARPNGTGVGSEPVLETPFRDSRDPI